MVQDIIATGFSGVLVDRNAYQDKGEAVYRGPERALRATLASARYHDRWVFFDPGVPAAQFNVSTTPA